MQKKNKEDSTVGWVATLDVCAAAMTLFSLSSKWEKIKKRKWVKRVEELLRNHFLSITLWNWSLWGERYSMQISMIQFGVDYESSPTAP